MFCPVIMVYFFHELTIQRGEGTIKEVIKCYFKAVLIDVDMPKTLQTKCKTCFKHQLGFHSQKFNLYEDGYSNWIISPLFRNLLECANYEVRSISFHLKNSIVTTSQQTMG